MKLVQMPYPLTVGVTPDGVPVIAFVHEEEGVEIFDPTISSCGRFEVSPSQYGLTDEQAKHLAALNDLLSTVTATALFRAGLDIKNGLGIESSLPAPEYDPAPGFKETVARVLLAERDRAIRLLEQHPKVLREDGTVVLKTFHEPFQPAGVSEADAKRSPSELAEQFGIDVNDSNEFPPDLIPQNWEAALDLVNAACFAHWATDGYENWGNLNTHGDHAVVRTWLDKYLQVKRGEKAASDFIIDPDD